MLVTRTEWRYIDPMVIEVHTREKPAIHRRTWASALLLLAVASGLAGVLSWARTGDPLAQRIEQPDWLISFRPPRWPGIAEYGATLFGPAFRFHSPTADGGVATMVVYRVENTGGDATGLCDRVLRADLGLEAAPLGWTRFTRLDTQLGPFRAVQMFDPYVGRVVRAAEFGGGRLYAISLKVQGTEIKPELYRLFDQMCSSVRVRPN